MELRIESIVGSSSLAIICFFLLVFAMVPFFIIFERKNPRPRDLVTIAVMSALGALGRALFAAVPSFKPTSAIVIITGMQFGPLAGFMTGTLSALASNMFLGQGPWTVWQMFAWGMIGFFSGILEKKGFFKKRIFLYLYGAVTGVGFGWFLNLQYLTGYSGFFTFSGFIFSCISSLSMDITHGISTVIFLAVLEKPWGKKLHRIKIKYGIMETL